MKKILAIDDSKINLELLKHIVHIHFSEYQFIQADSGQVGLDTAIKEKPEIILLDIIMPDLDGYEVCTILKNNKITQHIPILLISALGQNSVERTKGLNTGADAFISKPFNQGELRAQINVALRIKKAEDLLRKRNESLELLIKDQTHKYNNNEERYLQISEHVLEFFWEIDSNGFFTYVSPVIEKTLFIKPDEIMGEKSYIELFQLNGTHNKKSKVEKFLENKTSFNDCEIELSVRGRKKIWLAISGFPVLDKNNDYFGMRGICNDITKRKQTEIALNKNIIQIKNYQKKLKNLNSELTFVEEKERRKIAENLHDSLGQTLSLAFIKLSSITDYNNTEHVKKVIDETSELLNKAIAESRSLTYDLSPPILYELGLIPAFNWKLGQIQEKHGITSVFTCEEQRLNIQKEFDIFLYRIVSELLTNVIKHANANKIEINIRKGKKFYYISVHDYGIGFNIEAVRKDKDKGGFGLMSITERLDNIKGELSITSETGIGTKAIIKIPFKKERNHENKSTDSR